MKVDSRYLWTFNHSSITCATHASVEQFLLNKIPAPAWMAYQIPMELFDQGRTYDGLLDLSPCDDGTLVAVFSDTRNDSWQVVGNMQLLPGLVCEARF